MPLFPRNILDILGVVILIALGVIILIQMQTDKSLIQSRAAAKIQGLIRGVLTRARVKRVVKDFFKRKMIIKELLETEENYIRDLSIVISDFQTPLLNKKIISKEESQTIFINIDQIRRLNELFFVTIFEQANKYWNYKIIFEKVEKEVHFFKMYFEYFNNYTASSTMIDQLMERKSFANFLDETRLIPTHRLLTLKDYLIKPVQRLPKYVLIMKQIKKRTPADHPDYDNIRRVLKLFEEVNQSNNEKLNRVLNNYKINQIQKKLLLPHIISEPGVEFILEEPVTVISNDVQIVEATLYLLNTELIIARKLNDGKEKFMISVPFKNGGGNIMTNEEHFFYKNTFTVQNGEGDSCTFLCNGEEQRDALIQKIFNQLMKAQQRTLQKLAALCNVKNRQGVQFLKKMTRLDLLPEVQILGTDERNDNMFKYTVYIVEIRIKAIKQKIFLRYSELLELQEDLSKQYGLSLKNQLIKTTWMTNHKPKRIEERKMAIQRFLKEILSKQEIIEHGQEVLARLGLPADFYRLPQYYKQSEDMLKRSAMLRSTSDKDQEFEDSILVKSFKRTSIFGTMQELDKQQHEKSSIKNRQRSKRISIQDILKANELHLGHFTRYTQIMHPSNHKSEPLIIDVLIPWIENQKGFVKQRVYMQVQDRVLGLIEQVAKQIGLKYFKDFRMLLQRQFAGRFLDDDECLPKVMEQMKCGKYRMIFKKMIYVTSDIEEYELRNDRIRLKIIASQVIYDCTKDKYLLDYQKILKLTILIGISQIFADEEQREEEEVMKILISGNMAIKTREMISNTFTSFYDATTTWIDDYHTTFPLMLQKLKMISRTNSQVFRTSGIRDIQKQYNTTQLGQLALVSIIMEMKNNIFFGSVSFIVQISHWFRKYLRKFGNEDEDSYDNRNCWLVIKYDSMHLYSISLTTCIFSFNYDELYKIQPYPSSILLHLREREIDFLKLKSTNSYSIRQLLLYYKNYNDIIKKMDEDEHFEESMIELVKEQNRQSNFRNTMHS